MAPNTLQEQELNLSRQACCPSCSPSPMSRTMTTATTWRRRIVKSNTINSVKLSPKCNKVLENVSCRKSVDIVVKFNPALLVLLGVLLCSPQILARPNRTAAVENPELEQMNLVDAKIFDDSGQRFSEGGELASASKLAEVNTDGLVSSTESDSDNSHHDGEKRYPVSTVEFERVETPFIIGIWILSASIAKIGFHMTPKLHTIFPESCLLIVVGVIIGIILFYATTLNVQPLTPNTFFFYMLPPIILDAGYFMPNRMFFDNIGTILLMAVVGTIWNIATIGSSLWACGLLGIYDIPVLDLFLFSSLISAVDPVAVLAVFEEIHVNEVLYIVVFGESLLNDAVTVVLYHMFESFSEIGTDNIQAVDIASGTASFFVVALGGTIIGVIWGFLTGFVTRFTDHVRVIEPIFIFVMAYLAYLNAEIFHMSGILAITFCGITMKNYVEANISHKSHTTVKYALKMLSSSSETIIFMFLGVATVNDAHEWNTWFIFLTILFCCVFRVLGVVILTAIANRFRIHKLSNVDQFVMSYGGLRGAVAFALVLLIDPHHVKAQPIFVTTTIAVIYFTVFLQGITIKPLVKMLKVKRAEKKKPSMNERIHERFIDHMMAGLEDIVGKTGNHNVRDKFKRIDNRFIRPYLIRDCQGAEPKILETYSKLTMRDAIEVMRRNPSNVGQMTGTESMSALFRNYTFGGRLGAPFLNTCPSFSNLENSSRNLDMQELDYNPSKKDLTDAKIHHLLAEELKPRRHRRLSYSRHAVDDRDLSTQVNYKMHMNIRRMVNDRKKNKRSKRLHKDGSKPNHVSFPEFQQNGSAKQLSNDYLHDVLHEDNEEETPQKTSPNGGDDWDDGLTFTAKSSHGADKNSPEHEEDVIRNKRKSHHSGDDRPSTPTATESVLPWKREDDDIGAALKQNEFPAWASNKEYLAYNSPSATFLGGITKPKAAKSVIGLFRRESTQSGSGVASDSSAVESPTTPTGRYNDKRSQSVCVGMLADHPLSAGFRPAAPFAVTASHRRNNRRGSMLEISGNAIPEENHSKSLPNKNYSIDSGASLDDEASTILRPLLGETTPPNGKKVTIVTASKESRPISGAFGGLSLTPSSQRGRPVGNGKAGKPSPLTALLSKGKHLNGSESAKQSKFSISSGESESDSSEDDKDYKETDKMS